MDMNQIQHLLPSQAVEGEMVQVQPQTQDGMLVGEPQWFQFLQGQWQLPQQFTVVLKQETTHD